MRYPGNATLTREMQQRILATFKQTLTAAAAGNRKEASLGCDFILRLDSLFGPARELQQRLEGGEGPVSVADLAAIVSEPAAQAAEPAEAAGGAAAAEPPPAVDQLEDLDLGDAEAATAPESPTAGTAPPGPPGAAEIPPQASEMPAIDDLSDLDVGIGAEPPAPGPAEPAEAAEAPAEVAPAATAEPAPDAPAPPAEPAALGALDELDDLDLSAAAEPEPPGEAAPEVEAPSEPPASEAPEAAASAATEATPEPESAAEPPEAPESPAPAPEPAPAPAEAEIPLDSEPAAQLDSESQQRITDLLAEGQEAFDGGEYQGAIDSWSRIFLIDIDHAEANRRIEEARKLKAEADRKVEEKFHEGVAQLEAGDADAAAASLRQVLDVQPSHLAARDYLEKLEAGELPAPAEAAAQLAAEEPPEALETPDIDLADEMEEAAPKPDRGKKAVGPRMVTVRKSPLKSKAFLIPAAAGLIVVLTGAWYLVNNWRSLFPNSAEETPATEARPDPVARAKGLHEQGKTPIAIAQLRRLPPDDPQYDEAQALIAQWELEQAPLEPGDSGPSPEELARREALVAEAGDAAERREYMLTSELLSEAAAIAPLRGPEVQLLAQADEQLQDLQNFITIFREGEWEMALRDLWLLHESDPGNRDVVRLLVDSYYNLGVRALQRGDAAVAAEQFTEALGLSADDPELQRLVSFSETYQTRQRDMLYRIFVKYLPFR